MFKSEYLTAPKSKHLESLLLLFKSIVWMDVKRKPISTTTVSARQKPCVATPTSMGKKLCWDYDVFLSVWCVNFTSI